MGIDAAGPAGRFFSDGRLVSVAPLAVFRITFGLMMLLSVIRFWWNGWIEKLYLQPTYFFSYRYFEWVKPIGDWTYLLFATVGLSAVAITIGYKFRLAAILFFLSFTYVELMDKTTYLNHYYFVSLLGFILIFLPAANGYSVDVGWRNARVPAWSADVVKIFVAVVYFYAGLAKLNSDWLLQAQPLATWLPAKYDIPLLGDWLQQRWVHYVFAWGGAAYDLVIPFLLLWRPSRRFAFVAVVIFHVLTRVLFPIGMFPYIMIVSALIFFDRAVHERLLSRLSRLFRALPRVQGLWEVPSGTDRNTRVVNWNKVFVMTVLVFHLLLPWRYLLHDGELFWTEEGYRFSWRVMLMEKAGYLNYQVADPTTGKRRTIDPSSYLSTFQAKQLATQPDFILEFAHFLGEEERRRTGTLPQVFAESYIALNGRRSQPYVNGEIDLMTVRAKDARMAWLMPFKDRIYGL